MVTRHFTDETFRFLADLEANNSKDWFDANRDRYEAHWKNPALAFIEAVRAPLAALDPPLWAEARLNASLRRINRDVRFSKDKSPYHAMLHMIFSSGGAFNKDAGMHLVLHPKGVGYGAGLYGLDPPALARLRDRIVAPLDGDALIGALDVAAEVGARIGEPDLARLPRGYEAEGRRAELLRHKAIVARTFDDGAPTDVMTGEGAIDWTLGTTRKLLPLIRWLSVSDARA